MKRVLLLFVIISCTGMVLKADDPRALPDVSKDNGAAKTNEQLAKEVKKRFQKENVTPYEAAMTALLKQWDPVGKTPDEVVALIGHPDEKDMEQMIYRFDNQLGGGSEWIFALQGGKIASVKHTSLEQ